MGKYVPVNEKGRWIGQYHPRSTISDGEVEMMRAMREERGKSYGQIALKFKRSINTVKKICKYERRAETPARWKRVG